MTQNGMHSWNLTLQDQAAKRNLERILKPKFYKVIPKYLILANDAQKKEVIRVGRAVSEAREHKAPPKYKRPANKKACRMPEPRFKERNKPKAFVFREGNMVENKKAADPALKIGDPSHATEGGMPKRSRPLGASKPSFGAHPHVARKFTNNNDAANTLLKRSMTARGAMGEACFLQREKRTQVTVPLGGDMLSVTGLSPEKSRKKNNFTRMNAYPDSIKAYIKSNRLRKADSLSQNMSRPQSANPAVGRRKAIGDPADLLDVQPAQDIERWTEHIAKQQEKRRAAAAISEINLGYNSMPTFDQARGGDGENVPRGEQLYRMSYVQEAKFPSQLDFEFMKEWEHTQTAFHLREKVKKEKEFDEKLYGSKVQFQGGGKMEYLSSTHSAFRQPPPQDKFASTRPKSAYPRGVTSYDDEAATTCMSQADFDYLRRPKTALSTPHLANASQLMNTTVRTEFKTRSASRPQSANATSGRY